MPAPLPKLPSKDIADAVKETVTISPRNKVGRSQTTITSPSASNHARPSQARSQSQDSGNRNDKSKTTPSKARSKKGSQHADVIDRLDFTGVGPMFHHDGPFDACAPSRNRQRNNAPIFAWTPRTDDPPPQSNGPYPAHSPRQPVTAPNYVDPPKKKVDAIAEAWGTHEPEPYEEFFAGGGTGRADSVTPASSIYNGRDPDNFRRARDTRQQPPDAYAVGNTTSHHRGPTRRPLVPPPKPVLVPDPTNVLEPSKSSPPLSPGAPKRTKSLMHRIRKMRDAPNVPVSMDDDSPPSPVEQSYPGASGISPRPTHRPQNSFLGRLGGSRNNAASSEKPEPFVYIEATSNKDLPATPRENINYLDHNSSGGYFDGSAPSSGLGRKTSLMKKMGRVVGRSKQ